MDRGLPSFSVIVPTFNRLHQPRSICLSALARLDYPAHLFEVIVVDDGGEAVLPGAIEKYAGGLNVRPRSWSV